MPPNVSTATGKANALAIALKFWNQGYHDYKSLIAITAAEIASLEHKPSGSTDVQGRARVAAAYVIASKSPSDYPGGIIAIIGNTVGSLPFVPSPVDQEGNPIPKPAVSQAIEAPVTLAQFLARLTDVRIWIRIVEVVGGGVLAVIAIRMLARETGVMSA